MGTVKSLCDWKKETILRRFAELRSIVLEPEFLCRKCGRVADDEKWLCKPVTLYPGRGKGKPKG